MKVKDLIAELQTMPPDSDVVLTNTDMEDEGILNRILNGAEGGLELAKDAVYLVPIHATLKKTFTHTQEELKAAFELVQNKQHWKNPINSVCKASELYLIEQAIRHFTGTIPTFTLKGPVRRSHGRFSYGEILYNVTADGYHLGPCGDH